MSESNIATSAKKVSLDLQLSAVRSTLPPTALSFLPSTAPFSLSPRAETRSTSSNFLTTTVTCIRNSCHNNLDLSPLLTSLQLACNLAGQPIPTSDITSAEKAGASTTSYSVTPGTVYYNDSGYYTPKTSTVFAVEASFFAQMTFPTRRDDSLTLALIVEIATCLSPYALRSQFGSTRAT